MPTSVDEPMRLRLCFLLLLLSVALLWGCAGAPPEWSVRRQIGVGDRQKDWALVYYQSWRRAGQDDYLRLARREMSRAIRTYFRLQLRIGHSYPDFYEIDRKRRELCAYLHELDRDAGKYRVVLEDTAREGCLAAY